MLTQLKVDNKHPYINTTTHQEVNNRCPNQDKWKWTTTTKLTQLDNRHQLEVRTKTLASTQLKVDAKTPTPPNDPTGHDTAKLHNKKMPTSAEPKVDKRH